MFFSAASEICQSAISTALYAICSTSFIVMSLKGYAKTKNFIPYAPWFFEQIVSPWLGIIGD
jgi:hypothetical protein